jgi:hypothetical protein
MHTSNAQFTTKRLSLLLLGVCGLLGAVRAGVPAFVQESIYSPNAASVSEVISTLASDVVILDGGLEQGLRLGMVCRVSRGFQSIGELIIIESNRDRSAALILVLVEETTIQAGDVARIQTLQNS